MACVAINPLFGPSSYQLRLAFRCGDCRVIAVRTRFRKLDRYPIRVVAAAQNEANSEGRMERRRNEASWMIPDHAGNTFSGWNSGDASEMSSECDQKRYFAGMLGAGVAGVILVTGLTFAALSIRNHNTFIHTGRGQHMESLTTQEEVIIASDTNNDRLEVETSQIKKVQDDSSKEDIDEHFSANLEKNEAKAEIEPRDENQSSLMVPDSETDNGSSLNSFTREESNGAIEKPEPTYQPKEDLGHAQQTNFSIIDANPPTFNNAQLMEMAGSRETEKSDNLLGFPSSDTLRLLAAPVALDIVGSSNLEGCGGKNPFIIPENDVEIITSSSTAEAYELNKSQQVSGEQDEVSVEGQNVTESGSSGVVSGTVVYPSKEEITNAYSETERSKTSFVSLNSGDSFTSYGIPAPSLTPTSLHPGNILVPAVVDQVQGQALTALQVLKVIEVDIQPSDICSRREYARWLMTASSVLTRHTALKVYPAMYIENITELAFDDVTPEDPDFSSIQGLAEAGLIESKLSRRDMHCLDEQRAILFSPESPLSRQDLVSWKMSLEKRKLPQADKKELYQLSGFIDIDKIHSDAWPALQADISAGEHGIIALAFGYTRLFQPDKPVTKSQAAIALATGEASDVVSEELARIEAESMAENAVAVHSALVAQVEKDINANFEKELILEREKIDALERMAEEAHQELEKLKAQKEEDDTALANERAAIESEMKVFSKLRCEVEDQLEILMSKKVEMSYEKETIGKLRKEIERENENIGNLQYELEVERKALSMARAWAEDEAKRAREHAKALEKARDRWERHGIKVVVDSELQEDASGAMWVDATKQFSVEGTIARAENLTDKLKRMATDVRGRSYEKLEELLRMISILISRLRQRVQELRDGIILKAMVSSRDLQKNSKDYSLSLKEGARRVVVDCKEGAEKLAQKFKT